MSIALCHWIRAICFFHAKHHQHFQQQQSLHHNLNHVTDVVGAAAASDHDDHDDDDRNQHCELLVRRSSQQQTPSSELQTYELLSRPLDKQQQQERQQQICISIGAFAVIANSPPSSNLNGRDRRRVSCVCFGFILHWKIHKHTIARTNHSHSNSCLLVH